MWALLKVLAFTVEVASDVLWSTVKRHPILLQAGKRDRIFLKGLAVVDDVAYFGIAPWAARSTRADPVLDCELAAFDLLRQQMRWRRKVRPPSPDVDIGRPHAW